MSAPAWFLPLGILGLLTLAGAIAVLWIDRKVKRDFGDIDAPDWVPETPSERQQRLARRNTSRGARRVREGDGS